MKRRNVLQLAGFGALPLFGADPAALPDGTLDESRAKLTREPFGDLRIYYTGRTEQLRSMTAGSLRLKPGMTPHPPHQHPEEEFMVVTEGTGEIEVEGRKTRVGPGTMMYCGANRMHGIVNTGKTPLLFYFYKWMK
jgi:mannose-6-phosphate isomerase-like protein (cupin superfamily)